MSGSDYSRRDFIKTVALGAAGLALPANFIDAAAKHKYNILFIMSDDHAYQAISCYDNKLINTPNIDRIAREGCRFINSFCTNSICGPSRAVLLTGKYSHKNGFIDNTSSFDGQQVTFPKILQKNGYQTAVIGKWHLKSDPTGFNFWSILPGQGDYYNPDFIEMGNRIKINGYVTDLIADKSIGWLKERDNSKPFCLLMHNKAPHRNWLPSLKYISLFEDKEFPIPSTYFDDYKTRSLAAPESEMSVSRNMSMDYDLKVDLKKDEVTDPTRERIMGDYWEGIYARMTEDERKEWDKVYKKRSEEYRALKLKGADLDKWKYQQYMKDYLRCVVSVDENVGKVLNYLDENNLANNTLVIYTSDQGFYLGEHGWFDKRFMYEQSLRMPLLMRLPGVIKPHTDNENMVMNLDFAPTFLDYAGVNAPKEMQGSSLRPVLEQNIFAKTRDAIYYHYFEFPAVHMVKRHYGIRTKKYKLIHFYYNIDAWELYDLEKDPDELNNVYGNAEYKSITENLKKKLYSLQKKYDDVDYKKYLPKQTFKISHKGIGLAYTLANAPAPKYNGNITDGMVYPEGELYNVPFKGWLGVQEKDFILEMDTSTVNPVSEIKIGFLQATESWIFMPRYITLYASYDGTNFEKVKTIRNNIPDRQSGPFKKTYTFDMKNKNVKKIRITAKSIGKCPPWHEGAGGKAWIFTDELIIE